MNLVVAISFGKMECKISDSDCPKFVKNESDANSKCTHPFEAHDPPPMPEESSNIPTVGTNYDSTDGKLTDGAEAKTGDDNHLQNESSFILHHETFNGVIVHYSEPVESVVLENEENLSPTSVDEDTPVNELENLTLSTQQETEDTPVNELENLTLSTQQETGTARTPVKVKKIKEESYSLNLSPVQAVLSSTNSKVVSSPNYCQPQPPPQSQFRNKERLVIIIWEVSFLFTENDLSARAFASAGIPGTNAMNGSIRRGLHDIFDLNLGFKTTNSLSCLVASEITLCEKLGIRPGLEATELLIHLRARIDLLIRFGLSLAPYADFRRASRWLATIAQLSNDAAPSAGRVLSAPFLLFFGTREDVFYRGRIF
jgi:hypothetical protein